MTRPPTRTTTITLSRDLRAVGEARRWLEEAEALGPDPEPECLEEFLVMASELVANVLMHTTSAPIMELRVVPGTVRVSVRDHSGHDPVVRARDPGRVGGNGLRIVEAWSETWGVDHHGGGGKAVWFTVGDGHTAG